MTMSLFYASAHAFDVPARVEIAADSTTDTSLMHCFSLGTYATGNGQVFLFYTYHNARLV
jgi:hypothetical protein